MTSTARDSAVRCVSWGEREIRYTIAFAARRRLAITVHPDLRVEVSAPLGLGIDEIERRIYARRAWIARHLRELSTYHPLPGDSRYVTGESHSYLGRQYRLRVHEGEPAGVWRADGWLHVRAGASLGATDVARTLDAWYAERARAVFGERLEQLRAAHARFRRVRPRLRVLWMKRRWGSCSAQGTISLNIELLRAPVTGIDYVLVHELCHLLEPRHSPKFYRMLGAVLPDWERRRDRLNRATGSQPVRVGVPRSTLPNKRPAV